MNKLILSIAAVTIFGLAIAGNSYAEYGQYGGCTPIYGGGQTCETSSKFVLDKKVLNPESMTKGGTETYVDNLTINDPKYVPNQTIKFELTVTNTGTADLNTITVTDTLPSYVTYVSGPGSYDSNSKTITFTVTDLKAGESRKFYVEAKTVEASEIAGDNSIVCAVNQASANYNGDESRDNSQFCIEKSTELTVMPAPVITETPSTGTEAFSLLGLIPAALGGFVLRRKSK